MGVNKSTTFQGVSFAEAKRIVEYAFDDCVILLDRNNITKNYEVHIVDKIDKKVIEKFKEHWRKNFIIKVYSLKYEL